MDILLLLFVVLIGCFGFVLLYGAPYVPIHNKQARVALDMLNLKKGKKLYELGCGDGKVLKMAARRGVYAVGYELNPLMYLAARLNTWRYRDLVTVRYGNFWKTDLYDADAVYVFLLDRFMGRLDAKLKDELRPGTVVASYVFRIPAKKPVKTVSGVHLYRY